MQAIVTKYLPATNTKGARIKATATGGASVTISYPHEKSGEAAHREAAYELLSRNSFLLMSARARNIYGGIDGEDRWAYAELAPGSYVYVPCFYEGLHLSFPVFCTTPPETL